MGSGYKKLAVALTVNAVLMFFITFANLADASHFHPSLNRVYMALMMTAPMGIVMLLVMRSMFENARLNVVLFALFAVMFGATFLLVRTQTPVGDRQFLRSMIPHHSSAILMCDRADLTDAEIARLCDEIIESQREEIAQMEGILARY
jgi:uncharacterized protein (DUF305 family)